MTSLVPRQRRWAAVAAMGLVVLALAVLWQLERGPRTGGPLAQVDEFVVAFPLPPEQAGTWGTGLPRNQTPSDVTIELIEPVNPKGLEILGVGVQDPWPEAGIGTAHGYPPPDATIGEVEGAVVPANGRGNVHALVGVRLVDGMTEGTIDGLRIRYRHDGVLYEDVLPDKLQVFVPERSES